MGEGADRALFSDVNDNVSVKDKELRYQTGILRNSIDIQYQNTNQVYLFVLICCGSIEAGNWFHYYIG